MANTGPPFFAADQAEADRARQHQVSAKKRKAYSAALQAKFVGSSSAFILLRRNWMPLINRERNSE